MLLIILTQGCSYSNSKDDTLMIACKKISERPREFVFYLETQPDKNRVYHSGFGRIVALNINNNKKYYLSEESYHKDPVFSEKNMAVYFLSSQGESDIDIQLLGLSTHKDIYKLDLVTCSFSIVNYREILRYRKAEIDKMRLLDDGDIYFSINNNILKYKDDEKKILGFQRIDNVDWVNDFMINLSKEKLYYSKTDDDRYSHLYEFDYKEKRTKEVRKSFIGFEYGNWSIDKNNFIFSDSTTSIYNLKTGKITELKLIFEKNNMVIQDAFFAGDDSLLVYISLRSQDGLVRSGGELYLYDLSNKKVIKQITNDGFMKGCIFINNK